MDCLSTSCTCNPTNQWFEPVKRGDIPPGYAACGFAVEGTRILLFGGMNIYEQYTNELYELEASIWEWKKICPLCPKTGPPPCPRLGHSFTIINSKVYLFGGLSRDSNDSEKNVPRYLNDLYTLDIKTNPMQWDIPFTHGLSPSPRESHTGVSYVDEKRSKSFLVIYGGMNGCRLGDIWFLDTDAMSWSKPVISGMAPLPRSFHTSTVIGNRMFVFGGWVPILTDEGELTTNGPQWQCTNTLLCLNLKTMSWNDLRINTSDKTGVPCARSGHCAVGFNTGLYIWSGRNRYRKLWEHQPFCNDMWFIEVEKPPAPSHISLVKTRTHSLEVKWTSIPSVQTYILQIQKCHLLPLKQQTNKTSASVQLPSVSLPQSKTEIILANLSKFGNLVQNKSTLQTISSQAENALVKILPSGSGNKVLTTLETPHPNMIKKSKTRRKPTLPKRTSKEISEKKKIVTRSNRRLKNIQTIADTQAVKVSMVMTNTMATSPLVAESPLQKIQRDKIIESKTNPISKELVIDLERLPENIIPTFKKCISEYPGTPSNIKIVKVNDEIHLSWKPPQSNSPEILEYFLYVAVKINKEIVGKELPELTFQLIYRGTRNQCVVRNVSLQAALRLAISKRTAIVFRIKAKNQTGYGPTIQIKWFQNTESQSKGTKRLSERSQTGIKKIKL
ncbi:hypothetical protein ABEB36_011050 [Hypothenemus hampei]|uniref:Fibronectin type-III domain-containing protein n=1 Tax=Hypothenemus hampei TaxID=57062 RepID=A0ABD1EGS1_HYPHA